MPHTDKAIISAYHEAGHAVAILAQPGELVLAGGPTVDTTGAPVLGGNACHAGGVRDTPGEIQILLDGFKAGHLTAKQVIATALTDVFQPIMTFHTGGIVGEKYARGLANPMTGSDRFDAVVGASDDIAQIMSRLTVLGLRLNLDPDNVAALCRDGLLTALRNADRVINAHISKLHAIAGNLLSQSGPTLRLTDLETVRIFQQTP